MVLFQSILGLHIFSTVMLFIFLLFSAVFLYQARYSDEAQKVILKLKCLLKTLTWVNVFLIVLLLSGICLAILHEEWSEGWVKVAGFMILLMGAINGALLSSRVRKILKASSARFNETEVLPAGLRKRVNHPWLWFSLIGLMGLVLGAVYIMSEQPALKESLVALVVSIVGGILMGLATRGDK